MKLYKLEASGYTEFFGTFENPIARDITMVAQAPDCSAFLFLCKDTQTALTGLTLLSTVPSGFDFTYCQEWGLTLNADVLARTILDIRNYF